MTAISALADVDIASMALSHLSLSTTIRSLNPPDDSAAAQTCAFWYPKCRNELLQSAPWNFAFTSTLLTSDSTALPGWSFAYQYPNDCLQPIAVTTAAGQRLGAAFWTNWWWPYPSQNYALPKIPFKVVRSQGVPGQLAILADVGNTPVYLFYIQCVTDTAMFDPMFSTTLSYLLGGRAGGPLRADLQKVQMCLQIYKQMRLETLAQHLNAAQQDPARDSPSVLART